MASPIRSASHPRIIAPLHGLADRVVSRLLEKSFRIVAFDFDQTIVKLHTFFSEITPANVGDREKKMDDFADLSLFRDIVYKLQEQDVHVAVASFGYRDVIQAYLEEAIPQELDEITILSRESSLTKSKMLRALSIQVAETRIPKDQIVLFDDDQRNCVCCRRAGYKAFLVNPVFGINQDFWTKWLEETENPAT